MLKNTLHSKPVGIYPMIIDGSEQFWLIRKGCYVHF